MVQPKINPLDGKGMRAYQGSAMLLASRRNMFLFAGGCLALTIALMDDRAPNRLIANSEALAERRAAGQALPPEDVSDSDAAGGPWDSALAMESGPVASSASARSSEGVGQIVREADPAPVADPITVTRPPALQQREIGRPPVPGVRERSNPLARDYADDGSRDMAADLRRALG